MAAVLALHLGLLTNTFASTPRTLTAKVDRVSDGDTVTATDARGTKLRIRLLDIGTPESAQGSKPGQPFGQEARQYLDSLIGGKIVTVEAHGPDQYKRILAVLFDGQVNVNLLMVAIGYAEVYRGAPCQAYCEDLVFALSAQKPKLKRIRELLWDWFEGNNDQPEWR